jgi:hypothetical protein
MIYTELYLNGYLKPIVCASTFSFLPHAFSLCNLMAAANGGMGKQQHPRTAVIESVLATMS